MKVGSGLVPALLVSLVLIGLAVYLGAMARKKLLDAGKIIDRKKDFMEEAEEFALRVPDPAMVTDALRALNYAEFRCRMQEDGNQQIFQFTGSGWAARLFRKDLQQGYSLYRFSFTNWKTRNGMPENALQMNQLLTAVEKMFLSIDPQTQVRSEPIQVKTKHNFF